MKLLPYLLALAGLAFGQTEAPRITGDRIANDGAWTRATGHVQVHSGAYRLEADLGTLHTETEETDLRGHARINLPARTDRIFVRYLASVLVSAEEVVISADHLNVKHGLLRGIGHVSVQIDGKQLQADEIEMFLNIGDARARGSIRVNGHLVPPVGVRTFGPLGNRRSQFPPDIIK